MKNSKTVNILLVEDDHIDAKAFLRAMQNLKIGNPVTLASDGVEGWEALQAMERPNMVILDINMPRMTGLELLRKIRADKHLHDTIVFMLTTSNDDEDKFDAYDLNVAGYMLKSDMGNSFVKAVTLVENYWKVVEFPVCQEKVDLPEAAASRSA